MITAIIGHGRSPEGRGWASRIDACDVVVRMWDWHWQPPDYGIKYDYGVLEIHWMIITRFGEFNCRTPSVGWLASDLRIGGDRGAPITAPFRPKIRSWVEQERSKRRAQQMRAAKEAGIDKPQSYQDRLAQDLPHNYPVKLPDNTEVIEQRKWTEGPAGKAIGGIGETGKWELSRGAIAGCWAASRSKAGDVVVMVGCDNMHKGVTLPLDDAFCKAYQQDFSMPKFSDYFGNVTKTGNHDFPAERRLVEHVAELNGVRVVFAQDGWP